VLPLAAGSADCVVALDFIEHVDDDLALLREFRRVLRPGGAVVASVPAYPSLWSPHDEFLHHKRRYRTGELEARLVEAGFELEERHGFNFVLLPVVAAVRAVRRSSARGAVDERGGGTDFFRLPRALEACVNALMAAVFAVESVAVRLLPIRFGVSLMVRARRPAA
jgi:SAM-dependent methyltransferase